MRKIISALVAFVVCVTMAGCSTVLPSVSTPISTVEKFGRAVSDLDMDAALECCDSSTRSTAGALLGLSDGILGAFGEDVNSHDFLAAILLYITDIDTLVSGEEYSISVVPANLQQEIYGDEALVSGTWTVTTVTGGNEQVETSDVTFDLIKEGSEWKIDLSEEINSAFALSS